MGDHQVESITQNLQYISPVMWARPLRLQKITGDRIVASGEEGISHDSTELTSDEDSHHHSLSVKNHASSQESWKVGSVPLS